MGLLYLGCVLRLNYFVYSAKLHIVSFNIYMFRFVNPRLVLLDPTEFALRICQPSLTQYVKWCKKMLVHYCVRGRI
jgi:hypothetical protein